MSTFVIGENEFNETYIEAFLDATFENAAFKADLTAHLNGRSSGLNSLNDIFAHIDGFILERMHQGPEELGYEPDDCRVAWLGARREIRETIQIYETGNKQNPAAVHWPNPERYPDQTTEGLLPFAEKLGLIDRTTPVGSAGSCFAWEISKNLQARGFNYVVTEHEVLPDLADGVYALQTRLGSPVRSSANWGILFNSPSFRQIAEKAFGERELPHLLIPRTFTPPEGEDIRYFIDPYREGVVFTSVEAFETNYPKHIEASRQALLQSEYFVVTLGLNECWEYVPDGSVIARNPAELNIRPLLRPRVLSVDENIANIQRLYDIVRAHNPDFKLIVSVSPVPFLATSQADRQHVITANTHSKAVLRVAAEELANRNDGIFYFPSFEAVTICTADPWQADLRHVSPAAVANVMRLFETMFVADSATTAAQQPDAAAAISA